MSWLVSIISLLSKMVKPLVAYFIYLAGKRAGRAARDAEQAAVNAEARKKYEEIEMEDRSEGPWLKG